MDLSELREAAWNPRAIDEASLAALGASQRAFGDTSGIVFNRRLGVLICGHQRLWRLREDHGDALRLVEREGRLEIATPTGQAWPVRVVDWDEPTSITANIAANSDKLTGRFTSDLGDLLPKVELALPDLSDVLRLPELGIPDLEEPRAGMTDPDDAPKAPTTAVTRPGDLWVMGDHRLLCGDSTKAEDVARLMGGERAALFATDPPYLVGYDGMNRPHGPKDWTPTYHEFDWDKRRPEEAEGFFRSFLQRGLPHCTENVPVYVWHASAMYSVLEGALPAEGLHVHQQIIWVKPTAVLGACRVIKFNNTNMLAQVPQLRV